MKKLIVIAILAVLASCNLFMGSKITVRNNTPDVLIIYMDGLATAPYFVLDSGSSATTLNLPSVPHVMKIVSSDSAINVLFIRTNLKGYFGTTITFTENSTDILFSDSEGWSTQTVGW